MTLSISKATARRTLFSALTALALAAALPQAGLAAATSDDGIWRLDARKSIFDFGSATLTLETGRKRQPGRRQLHCHIQGERLPGDGRHRLQRQGCPAG